eukprot:TRINITY_DN2105_c0_g1_i1.p1 TRINITY_DN2105_c0_g1~~TRINITY_DN2105_c0_g1_i1.p1  ORF type:complete len:339 (-),score=36.34 TRINITY_DN2105_c0_g1_i1:87-1103(-)
MEQNQQPAYQKPTKRIHNQTDLKIFLNSPTCHLLRAYLGSLNDCVKGKSNSTECHVSPAVERVCSVLNTLAQWVDDIPPIQQPMRYGNKAYRDWFEKNIQNAEDLMKQILPEELHGAAVELAAYWTGCFGDKTRIDYGTGHETTFMAFCCCLQKLGVLGDEDRVAVVLKVFNTYLGLMRKLQRTYFLEPAGSHGVWSLDDYQFLPFYFGSSQLAGHRTILPKSVRSRDIVEAHSDNYMYLACIKFIYDVKSGAFAENSPILDSIAEVPMWEKVNQGMLKMYNAEVLGKFPVMQHFLFGSILPFPEPGTVEIAPSPTTSPATSPAMGHHPHAHHPHAKK